MFSQTFTGTATRIMCLHTAVSRTLVRELCLLDVRVLCLLERRKEDFREETRDARDALE